MGDQVVRPLEWPTLSALWHVTGREPDERKAVLLREMSAAFVRGYNEARSRKFNRHPESWKENRRMLKRLERNGAKN